MKRSAPLRRTKPIAKRNVKRRQAAWAVAFESRARVRFIAGWPCLVCGRGRCENAHIKSRGAGGKSSDIVPLCVGPDGHHAEQHRLGIETFQRKHGLDLRAAADQMEALWQGLQA